MFGSVLLSGIWALDNPSQNYIDITDVVSLEGYWGFRQIGSGPAQLQIDGQPLLFAGRHVQLDVDWNVKGPADTIDRDIYFWDDSDYCIVPAAGQMKKGRAYWIHIESISINVNASPFK